MNIIAYKLHQDSTDIFPIESADYKREWMDNYPHAFAYRCLPLKIANEAGWLVRCPIDFHAEYIDDYSPTESVKITIEENNKSKYQNYIRSHFGKGVITFSIPYVFRTPEHFCLWARGYPNYYKDNISFLEGIIETYWSHSTFTYNVRIVEKNKPVFFKKGEPLMFLTCIDINQINKSTITYADISDNPELQAAYDSWQKSRNNFNQQPRSPEDWQKDYFKGLNAANIPVKTHITTIKTNIQNN